MIILYNWKNFLIVVLSVLFIVSSTTLGSQQDSQDCDNFVSALNDYEAKKDDPKYIAHQHIKEGGEFDFTVDHVQWIAKIFRIDYGVGVRTDEAFNNKIKNGKVVFERSRSYNSLKKCLIGLFDPDPNNLSNQQFAFITVTNIKKIDHLKLGKKTEELRDKTQGDKVIFRFSQTPPK